jgi:phosphotransferase family enzyme
MPTDAASPSKLTSMNPTIEGLLLSFYPPGAVLLGLRSYRPAYAFYPALASVRTPDGGTSTCVVKTSDRIDTLSKEARVLRALAEIGLPVPAVLAGPTTLPDQAHNEALLLLSELPGQPLPWIALTSLAEANRACRLLIEGVRRLHQLTEPLRRHEIAPSLPHDTLASELNETVRRAGEWLGVAPFVRAVDYLSAHLAGCELPLVFSNGDYNPLNFLHDGKELTAWIDFAGARFEDPHIGFAKFVIWAPDDYGWGTGAKAGLVERYLYTRNVSRREFLPRLMLRCLRHLIDETPLDGTGDPAHRAHMLRIVEDCLLELT